MLELDPFSALALSLQHAPGVYALLVGSGLSRAAGIPTGWEITLDLIRRLASLEGVTEHEDWALWFRKKFEKEPNYSEILDALGATPSERRSILHSYIEPLGDEETRRPTKAHRAIAKLVADGHVRVVITTNFDRLIENALREAGVEPTVVASEDALAGATPLVHTRCTVLKLHGDYLDTRIRNTDTELAAYGLGLNSFLDEVIDRFGLIVVGWSGEWDAALRAALLRAPNRRYPLYWATRGKIAALAQDIIAHRSGRSIEIADADEFFSRLSDTVDALQQASRPHPQSVAIAIELAKRYCRDDRYALEWAEFLATDVAKIRGFVSSEEYKKYQPTNASVNGLIASFVSRSEVLRRACLVSGFWGTVEAKRTVSRSIRSLGFRTQLLAGSTYWSELRDFCASLCFYWALAGMVARDDFAGAHALMHSRIRVNGKDEAFVLVLPLVTFEIEWKLLAGLEQKKTPASEFLFGLFQREIADATLDPREADELFDRIELLISLEYLRLRIQQNPHVWTPPGRFLWKWRHDRNLLAAFENLATDHPLLRAGLLGGDVTSANETVAAFRKFIESIPPYY